MGYRKKRRVGRHRDRTRKGYLLCRYSFFKRKKKVENAVEKRKGEPENPRKRGKILEDREEVEEGKTRFIS